MLGTIPDISDIRVSQTKEILTLRVYILGVRADNTQNKCNMKHADIVSAIVKNKEEKRDPES